jgi:predicted SAM-dependent methyltransferase
MIGVNCGSGQRPFDTTQGWINLDCNTKWNPDIVGDWNDLSMFDTESVDVVVSCHSMEHAGCGEADGFIRESHRILKERGRLILLVPDPRAIAQRLLTRQIDEYTYNVLTYGAYMDHPSDRHAWSYSRDGLIDMLHKLAKWYDIHAFDYRTSPPGSDLPAPDWWFYATEAVK